jgi:hypothetical protein
LVKVGLWMRRNPTKSVAGGVAVVAFGIISVLLAENVRARAALGRVERARSRQQTRRARRGSAPNEPQTPSGAKQRPEQAERRNDLRHERLAAAAAERSAAAEKRRADEVLRLSAIQDYEDLLGGRGPSFGRRIRIEISAYEALAEREREALTAELPRHRAASGSELRA